MKQVILHIILSLFCIEIYGQQENIWIITTNSTFYFNKEKVDNKLELRYAAADYAKSTICDKNGNLKLYTNGDTLYNKNNEMLQNGSNIGGHGRGNSKILEMPNTPNTYIVLCADIRLLGSSTLLKSRGLTYALVEFNVLYPNGIVSKKLIPILPRRSVDFALIKMTNDSGYWLAARTLDCSSDSIFIFKIDRNGITKHLNQKINILDCNCNLYQHKCWDSPFSQRIKFSPKGSYLICNSELRGKNILSFDIKTGKIKKVHRVMDTSSYTNFEFSPNEKYIYCNTNDRGFSQFKVTDLLMHDSIQDVPSQDIPGGFSGDIQLGINGKIYLSQTTEKSNVFGCIDFPNEKSPSIQFADSAITIKYIREYSSSPNTHYTGLAKAWPNLFSGLSGNLLFNNYATGGGRFISTFRLPQIVPNLMPSYIEQLQQCSKDSFSFYVHHYHRQDSIQWYVNNALIRYENTNFVKFKLDSTGAYNIIAIIFDSNARDTISDSFTLKIRSNILVSKNIALCDTNKITLQSNAGYSKYMWNTGDTLPTIIVSKPGWYKVAAYYNGCFVSDSVFIQQSLLQISGTLDVTVGKPPLIVNFEGKNSIAGTTNYKWHFGDTKQAPGDTAWGANVSYTYQDTGRYYPRLIGITGPCRDTVNLSMVGVGVLGIKNAKGELAMRVFPNPTGAAQIAVLWVGDGAKSMSPASSAGSVGGSIAIYNALGTQVGEYQLPRAANSIKISMPTPGIYLILPSWNASSLKWVVE